MTKRKADHSSSVAATGGCLMAPLTTPLRNDNPPLQIVNRRMGELRPAKRRLRRHAAGQIRKLARSLERFGPVAPIIIDGDGTIIDGHAVYEAARQLEWETIPTVQVGHLTAEEQRALRLALNKLPETTEWDLEALALEFAELSVLDLDFDLTLTGFETPEIDALLSSPTDLAIGAADEVPEPDPGAPAVSCLDDLWLLGPHRILCGDATDQDAVSRLMNGQHADQVFVDPPYNVRIDGHVCGGGRIHHREFVMGSGEMTEDEFTGFLRQALDRLGAASREGAVMFVCMDWRHGYELQTAARSLGLTLLNLCVWDKGHGGMGSLYRSRHELLFVYRNGREPHVNNVQLGRHGRNRTNVWSYPGLNTFRSNRQEELALHPTVKPVAMVADAILDCSSRGAVVLDTFAGSGTTIIACEMTGRRGYTMELDPLYVDVAIRRWESRTGKSVVHASTSQTFADLAAIRSKEAKP